MLMKYAKGSGAPSHPLPKGYLYQDIDTNDLYVGDGSENHKYVKDSGVKVYRALLTQSGTNAPVATVLENTLGGTPVWSRQSAGSHRLTLAGAFPLNRTVVFVPPYFDTTEGTIGTVSCGLIDSSTIQAEVWTDMDGMGTDFIHNAFIEILVYPES